MATNDDEIFDKIRDICVANLPSVYRRLSDPYNPDQNIMPQLLKGFGIATGAGVNTERFVGCQVTWARSYNILLVQQITTTQNNIDARENIDAELRTDVNTLWKKFYLNSGLDGLAIKTTVLGDGGIVPLDIGGLKFLSIELFLEVEYMEDPNS